MAVNEILSYQPTEDVYILSLNVTIIESLQSVTEPPSTGDRVTVYLSERDLDVE